MPSKRKAAPAKGANISDPAAGKTPQVDERYACFKLTLAKSKIHRWGLYALERIPPHRKIIEYTGEKLNRKQTKDRDQRELHYLFTLNSYWTIDGAVGGSGAEFINHSCEPSVRASIIKDHILYFSKRWIEKGEELTIDYHFAKDVETVYCKCGTKGCRGTINLKE
jgi:uncharacterized protein